MRVLLTGHKGYIGAVAAPMLKSAGHTVVGLDTGLFEGCVFGDPPAGIPEISKDLRQIAPHDLEGFDAVVHLCALSNDPLGNLNPSLTYDINHLGSNRLAAAAKAAGVSRFVFSSSCSTYGAAGDDFLTESAALSPVTAYAESKVFVERDVASMACETFSPVFLRNATAYGVSPYLRLDVVLNNLVAHAYTSGRIYLKSDGTPWRPIVHIEDITRAVLCALAAPQDKIHNQVYNVGVTEENYRISELAGIVLETVPGCRVEYAPDAGPDRRCYRVNFSKILNDLPGFKPVWNARSGARELYQAFQTFGLTQEDVEGSRYTRISRINELTAAGSLSNDLYWLSPNLPQADRSKFLSQLTSEHRA